MLKIYFVNFENLEILQKVFGPKNFLNRLDFVNLNSKSFWGGSFQVCQIPDAPKLFKFNKFLRVLGLTNLEASPSETFLIFQIF